MRKFLKIILLIICLAVFIFSAYKIFNNIAEEKMNKEINNKLVEKAILVVDNTTENESETKESLPIKVDFSVLKQENQDIVGWIYCENTPINYPVLQSHDNEYYLRRLINGEYNTAGSIFMDYHNRPDFSDQNTIIYGHNMKDDSMFGKLNDYQDRAIYEENPSFYIYVPGKVMKYQIFSCYAGSVSSEAYIYSFPEISDFMDFTEAIISFADYETGVTVGETDRVVTLSTCVSSGRSYRYLVHGKLTEVNELRYLEKI